MCNKADNSCRQEKLGCKGCKYYNVEVLQSTIESLKGHKPFLYTNEDKIQAIEQLIYENMYLLDIRNLYEDKIKHYVQIIEKLYKENIELKNNFISKTQVKNKIKEIDNFPSSTNEERDEHLYAMEVLNELLKYFK